jgi:cell division protein FtsW (lipid II flippase)
MLLIGVLFVGRVGMGAPWIALGVFDVQPSELAKLALILVLARYVPKHVRGGWGPSSSSRRWRWPRTDLADSQTAGQYRG